MSNSRVDAAAADEATETIFWFFGATNIGLAILLYGLFFAVAKITNALVALDVGVFKHLFAFLGTLFCMGFFLVFSILTASLHRIFYAIIYSAGLAILSRPLALETGLFGQAYYAKSVYFIVVFLILFIIINKLFKRKLLGRGAGIAAAIIFVAGLVVSQCLDMAVDVADSAGYIREYEYYRTVLDIKRAFFGPIDKIFEALHFTETSQFKPL